MVGEMRGRKRFGHRRGNWSRFFPLHTNSASQTVTIIVLFRPINNAKSACRWRRLIGIFSQRLIPRTAGGLVPAYELLLNNNAVANLVREGRTAEIDVVIETGSDQGMVDMNHSLAELVRRGDITQENAFRFSINQKGLERLL